MNLRAWMAASATLLLAGCMMGPDYKKPAIATPDSWRTESGATNSLADMAWWDLYSDPVLTNLIASALANNKDMAIAAARVEEALAGYHVQRSFLFPSLDASAKGTKAQVGDIPPVPGADTEQYDLFGLLSYELDVWGRLRRLNEAARAQFLASEEVQRTVGIGLVASVASSYFNLRALDRQLDVAQSTLASRSNSLELVNIRFDGGNGIVSALDVAQAETHVYSAQSSIANLERAVAVAENALSALLGRNPGRISRGESLENQLLPLEIPAGLPSDLLLRRPDLRAAEQALIAANANIGAARAAYFPRISLTGALGLQSAELGNLFETSTSDAWSFVPQATMPIFQGGRVRANVRIAEAQRKAALANYEKAIQNAFREVDDALVTIAQTRKQLAADEAGAGAERRRLELSQLRYDGGVASYSDVLDAQRFLFNAELTAIQTRNSLLNANVQLYRALGGGWTDAK